MEFRELVEHRPSIRNYSADPVDPRAIDRILHLVSRAPSAGNLQTYRIFVVRSVPNRRAPSAADDDQE